jgi:hypothetical protein
VAPLSPQRGIEERFVSSPPALAGLEEMLDYVTTCFEGGVVVSLVSTSLRHSFIPPSRAVC